MKKFTALFRVLLLIFPALFFSSCLEGDEEYWINADGSGRLRMEYKVPAIALKELGNHQVFFDALQEIDALEEGIRIHELKAEAESGQIHFFFEADFDDVRDLFSLGQKHAAIFRSHGIAKDDKAKSVLGDFSLERMGLQFHLRREMNLAVLWPEMIKKNPAILGPATFNYTVHLPSAVDESNAHDISADKKTLKWHAKLKEHTVSPIVLEFRASLPYPKWLVVALVFIGGTFVFFLWKRRKNRTRA